MEVKYLTYVAVHYLHGYSKRAKFYVPCMTIDFTKHRYLRRKCNTATEAVTYGQNVAVRYIRLVRQAEKKGIQ